MERKRFASLPRENVNASPPRHVLERNYNIVQYTALPRDGHFALRTCGSSSGNYAVDCLMGPARMI